MADGVEVGRAHVSVVADGRPAVRQVEADFRRGMPAVGKKAGGHIGSGILAAAKGFAGPVAALFALDKIGGFFKDANAEARESQKVSALTTQAIKTTGGAAHVTAKQVGTLATAISKKTGVDDEQIQSNANLLLTFTKVRNEAGKGNDIFNQSVGVVQDMSVAFKESGKAASIQLGKALQDPVKGITALARVGVTFDAQQQKQIKTFVKSGNVIGAQKIILAELRKETGGAAAATATAGEKMAVAWGNFEELIGTALLPVIDKVENAITTLLIPALSKVVTFLSNQAGPAFNALRGFVARLFASFQGGGGGAAFLGTLRSLASTVIANLLPAFRAVASFIITSVVPAFLSIVSAVRHLYAVIIPIVLQIVGVIIGKFVQMRPQIISIWNSIKSIITGVMFIIQRVIHSVTTIISLIWAKWGNTIKAVVGGAFRTIVNIIAGVMKVIAGIIKLAVALIKGDWRGAWNAIKQIFSGVWQAIKAILSAAWAVIKGIFRAAFAVVRAIWTAFWNALKDVANRIFVSVRDRIKSILGSIRDAFRSGVSAIGRAWDGLKSIAKKPVDFVVRTVINNGLISGFNFISGKVGGPTIPKIPWPPKGWATGGILPGYTPGRDVHRFVSPTGGVLDLSGGEGIARPELVKAIGARRWNAANAAAARGQLGTGLRYLGGFAGGGIFDFSPSSALSKLKNIGGGLLGDIIAKFPHLLVSAMKKKITDLVSKFTASAGGGLAGLRGFSGGGGSNRALGRRMMLAAGWSASQWPALNALWTRESGWNTHALNRSSGAYGIPQSLPASKMASAGSDWRNNPATQIRWGLGYIKSRYGSPAAAWAHSQRTGWYAGGTPWAAPGWAVVGERGAELMQMRGGERIVSHSKAGGVLGGVTITGGQFGYSPDEIAAAIIKRQRQHQALNPVF